MSKTIAANLRSIKLSEIEALKESGYELLSGGDASKANGDYFAIMIRHNNDGGHDVKIVCPTFLRGPLGITNNGRGFSY